MVAGYKSLSNDEETDIYIIDFAIYGFVIMRHRATRAS